MYVFKLKNYKREKLEEEQGLKLTKKMALKTVLLHWCKMSFCVCASPVKFCVLPARKEEAQGKHVSQNQQFEDSNSLNALLLCLMIRRTRI